MPGTEPVKSLAPVADSSFSDEMRLKAFEKFFHVISRQSFNTVERNQARLAALKKKIFEFICFIRDNPTVTLSSSLKLRNALQTQIRALVDKQFFEGRLHLVIVAWIMKNLTENCDPLVALIRSSDPEMLLRDFHDFDDEIANGQDTKSNLPAVIRTGNFDENFSSYVLDDTYGIFCRELARLGLMDDASEQQEDFCRKTLAAHADKHTDFNEGFIERVKESLAQVLHDFVFHFDCSHDIAPALAKINETIAIIESLSSQSPEQRLDNLIHCYIQKGRLLQETKQVDEALDVLETARGLIVNADHLSEAEREEHYFSVWVMVDILLMDQYSECEAKQDFAGMRAILQVGVDYQLAIVESDELADTLGRNQQDYANTYVLEAQHSYERGDYRKALEDYRQARAEYGKLSLLQTTRWDLLGLIATIDAQIVDLGRLMRNEEKIREAMKNLLVSHVEEVRREIRNSQLAGFFACVFYSRTLNKNLRRCAQEVVDTEALMPCLDAAFYDHDHAFVAQWNRFKEKYPAQKSGEWMKFVDGLLGLAGENVAPPRKRVAWQVSAQSALP